MMWRLVGVSLLLTLAGGSQADGFIKSMIEPYADCKFGTMSCNNDCTKVMICLGGSDLEELETCASGSKCDARNNSCNTELKTCNAVNQDKFTCRGPVGGNYPNPYDCHSYFTCPAVTRSPTTTIKKPSPSANLRVDGAKKPCSPNTTAYDSLSGSCRFTSNHRVCKEGPVPKCTTQGQSGGLIENPNIYYLCVSVTGVLQPWLLKCKNATAIFQDGNCVTPPDWLHQPRWVATN